MNLIVVGLGIKFFAHLTKEAETVLRKSDKVLYLTNDDHYESFIHDINPASESLESIYFSCASRAHAYQAIQTKILSELQIGKTLCFAIYGHPTFFVQTVPDLYEHTKRLGLSMKVLPAVSAMDCMLADLCINPGDRDMQIFDATNILVYKKQLDWSSHIFIYQLGAVGESSHLREPHMLARRTKFFCDYLAKQVKGDPKVVIYEASQLPKRSSVVTRSTLKTLYLHPISPIATIYIPPVEQRPKQADVIDALLRMRNLDTTP